MSGITFRQSVISDRLQALTRGLDSDPERPGRLVIVGADQVLATLVFPRPSLNAVSGRTLTLRTPETVLVQVTGEAVTARFESGVGQVLAEASVGLPGSGAAVELTTTSGSLVLYAGGELSVTLAQLVEV